MAWLRSKIILFISHEDEQEAMQKLGLVKGSEALAVDKVGRGA
jgi:hypothetical protein